MKKVLKAVKLTGISVTASFAVLGAIYFFETKPVSADSNQYKVVVEDYSQPSTDIVVETPSVVASVSTVESVDKADVNDASDKAGPSEVAEEDSEDAGKEDEDTDAAESVEASDEAGDSVETPTEPDPEEPTEAPTQPATEPEPAPTQPVAPETAAPTQAPAAAPTQAPTPAQPATQAPTLAPAQPAAPVTTAPAQTPAQPAVTAPAQVESTVSALTSIKYNGNTYNSIEEAKAAINVATLTDEQAKSIALVNKAKYASEVQELVNMINQYRAENGLPALAFDDTLTTAAMHRAAESAYSDWNMTASENGAKRHIRPNFQKASSIGDYYGIKGNFGENYARYYYDADELLNGYDDVDGTHVNGWKGSASHNKLLLSGDYSKIGIGIAQASDAADGFYWIAIFN